ncbi:hypothetical protein EDD85DRAFT_939862 [Armillaria nabsnona]|nr:hypothetical protein EDD85DRAFT_939862 [Armillaria nabsnona]
MRIQVLLSTSYLSCVRLPGYSISVNSKLQRTAGLCRGLYSSRSLQRSLLSERASVDESLVLTEISTSTEMRPRVSSLTRSERGGRGCGINLSQSTRFLCDPCRTENVYHNLSRSMDYLRVITLRGGVYRNEVDMYSPDWQRAFPD